jgi:hypothetical protein
VVYKSTIDNSSIQKVEMLEGSCFINPNNVVVKVNLPVEITIRKEPGSSSHDIVRHALAAGIELTVDLSRQPKGIRRVPTKIVRFLDLRDSCLKRKGPDRC